MTTNNTLCAPESIHSLSAMGEALTAHEDYPFDWVEDICNNNDWLNLEDIGRWREDICTNGRDILYWTYDRNDVFVADTRECTDEDFAAWEDLIVKAYPEYNDCLDTIREWRKALAQKHTTRFYLLDVVDLDEFTNWFNGAKPMILEDAEVGHDRYDGPYLLVHDEGLASVVEAARKFLKNNKIRYVED